MQMKMFGSNITEQPLSMGEVPLDGRQGGPHFFI
jgi:hypothetical protein